MRSNSPSKTKVSLIVFTLKYAGCFSEYEYILRKQLGKHNYTTILLRKTEHNSARVPGASLEQ